MIVTISACSGGSSSTPVAQSNQSSANASAHTAAETSSSPPASNVIVGAPSPPAVLLTPGPSATNFAETPRGAHDFTASAGVNVDLPDMPPSIAPAAADALKALGVKHVRIAILRQDPSYDAAVAAFLARSGTTALGITNCSPPLGPYAAAVISASDIAAFDSAIGGRLEAYEAMNEPDIRSSADPNWVSDLKACMKNQTGAVAGLPFFAPAISDEDDKAQSLGDQSATVNAGNFHRYLAGRNPATPGYGSTNACGVYAALYWAMCEARVVSASKPLYITEMGYNSTNEVDLTTQAKYLSRALLVNFNAGIVRTYFYCLISYAGADGFGGDGILNADLTPKPAYTAIQSTLSIMADSSGSAVAGKPLSYTISGGSPSLAHALIQKSDGSFALALWNETQSWNPTSKIPNAVSPSQVTVTISGVMSDVTAWSLDDSGAQYHPAATIGANGFSLPVDDHVSIVQFTKVVSL